MLNWLMFALNEKIQTNWAELVNDTIPKAIRFPLYLLPYGLFLSKVFECYKVDLAEKASIVYFIWKSYVNLKLPNRPLFY